MTVRLRFITNPKSIVSAAIRWATFSEFSHVEFALPEGYLGAHADGGVLLRHFDYDPSPKFAFARIECGETTTRNVIQIARAQIGKPYDMTAIVGLFFNRDWRQPDSWFCSELVEYCFDAADCALLDDHKHYNRITPRDIVLSRSLVWE